jgi:hypothetical protein
LFGVHAQSVWHDGPLREFVAKSFRLKIYVGMVNTPAVLSDVNCVSCHHHHQQREAWADAHRTPARNRTRGPFRRWRNGFYLGSSQNPFQIVR